MRAEEADKFKQHQRIEQLIKKKKIMNNITTAFSEIATGVFSEIV